MTAAGDHPQRKQEPVGDLDAAGGHVAVGYWWGDGTGLTLALGPPDDRRQIMLTDAEVGKLLNLVNAAIRRTC